MPSLETIKALTGQELGVSPWLLVDQDLINRFAEVTNDRQFIHVDPDRAKETPFGGTIAHGLLTLSVLPALAAQAVPQIDDRKMGANYGYDKIRFIAPVRSGSNIRARFKLLEFNETKPGQWRQAIEVTVEIENEAKPALRAEWIVLHFM